MKKRMARILRIRVMACVLSLAMILSFTLPAIAVAVEFSGESTTTAAAEYVPAPVVEEVADEEAEPVESPDEAVPNEDDDADLADVALSTEPETESDEDGLAAFALLARMGDMREWIAMRPQIFAGTQEQLAAGTAIPSSVNGDVYFFYYHRAHLNIVGNTVTNYRQAFTVYTPGVTIQPLNPLRDFRPAPQTDWVDGIVLNNALHATDTNSFGMPIWDVTILNQPASTSVDCAICGENPSICAYITQENAVQSTVVFPGSAANQTLYLDIRILAAPGEAPRVIGGTGHLTTLLPATIAADYLVSDYELDYIASIARTNDTWALTLYLAPLQGGGGQGPTRAVEFTVYKFPYGSTTWGEPTVPAYAVAGETFSFVVPLDAILPGFLYQRMLTLEWLRDNLPAELIAHFDGIEGFNAVGVVHTALVNQGEGNHSARIILIGEAQVQTTPVSARIDFCYGTTPGLDGACRQHDLAPFWAENIPFVYGDNIPLAKILELIREHTGFTGEGFGEPMFKLWTDEGDIRLPGVAYLTWEQVFGGFDEYHQDYEIFVTVFFPMLDTQPPPPVPCDLCEEYECTCCDVCERHPCDCPRPPVPCDSCHRDLCVCNGYKTNGGAACPVCGMHPRLCECVTEPLEREERERPERPRPGDGTRRAAAEGPKTGDSNSVFAQMAVMALVAMTIAATGLARTREQD